MTQALYVHMNNKRKKKSSVLSKQHLSRNICRQLCTSDTFSYTLHQLILVTIHKDRQDRFLYPHLKDKEAEFQRVKSFAQSPKSHY
jgi:hypothetical protein